VKKKTLPLVMFSILFLVVMASPFVARVYAAPTWTVTLVAKLGAYTGTTILGVANDATEGFDIAYDAYAPLAPPTGVWSYFWHPSNPSGPPDARRLSTSIIPPAPNMNWTLRVTPYGLDGTMVLNWTTIPAQYSAYIMDSTGTTTLADMTQVSEYSYSASDSVMVAYRVNFVIPEFPIAPMLALALCFASYGVFRSLKRVSRPIV